MHASPCAGGYDLAYDVDAGIYPNEKWTVKLAHADGLQSCKRDDDDRQWTSSLSRFLLIGVDQDYAEHEGRTQRHLLSHSWHLDL